MSIKRNTFYNTAGAILPLGVTLLTLPHYLAAIGEVRYGVLAILWTLLGYFGLFDLGIGRAVTNRIAAMRGAASEERAQVFWTALLLNGVLGVAGALLFWVVGSLILSQFVQFPPVLTTEVRQALPWIVLAFPLLLIAGVLSGALQGREEFLVQNAVTVVGAVLVQLAPLGVAVWVAPTLPNLVAAVMTVRVLSVGALYFACRSTLPVRSGPRFVPALAMPLLKYGGWITVSSIVAPLLTTLDRVIIGAVLGARAVTYYVVPYNLATRITIFPGALAHTLFPRFSAQSAADAAHLLYRSTRLILVATLPVIVAGVWFMEPFLTFWMGQEFAGRSALAGQWIVLGLWANVFAYPAYSSLPARGRPDLLAKLQIAEAVPYLPALWFALHRFGVAGAAAIWALRTTVDAGALLWLARVDVRIWRAILHSFGFLCLGVLVTIGLPPPSAPSAAGMVALLMAIAFWMKHAEPDLFASLKPGGLTKALPIRRGAQAGSAPISAPVAGAPDPEAQGAGELW